MMNKHDAALKKAREHIKAAEHMVNVTYNFVNDRKMLISIAATVKEGLSWVVAAILYYEVYSGKIPKFNEDFETMFSIFKARCIRRYRINTDYINLIEKLRSIQTIHKNSPIEFTRGNKVVMCTEDYTVTTITKEDIINYINKARLFIEEAEKMVKKNA